MEAFDFMDPKRRRHYSVQLLIGYVLIGIAIILLSIILMFVAYGFGYKNGQVIQNGLVFLSSSPSPAQIYLNGERYKSNTNTRIILPAGTYKVDLKRAGYRDWQESIEVDGGQVEPYTYPELFPLSLTTNTVKDYAIAPALSTQSPDARWALITQPGSLTSFDEFDLSDVKKAPTLLTLPSGLLSNATSSQSLQVIEWANDNSHVLLQHTYDGSTEYIILNRSAPDQSVNLTRVLSLPSSGIQLELSNQRSDQYVMYNASSHILSHLRLDSPLPQTYLSNVLAFKNYGDNMTLFVAPDALDAAKVDIKLYNNGNSYLIRTAPVSSSYLLDINEYSGELFVAFAAPTEGVAYIYRDPLSQIEDKQLGQAIPAQVFRLKDPSYVSFSPGSQFIIFESGTDFAVYDTDRLIGYTYSTPDALDAPQTHAYWMDGARLDYIAHGQITVFDYDGANRQVLVSASAQYKPVFTPSNKYLYTFVQAAADPTHMLWTNTSLRIPADQ